MGYFEYRDLAPIDNIENGDKYIEALNWAFQNKKVKNIALTGPYGWKIDQTAETDNLVLMAHTGIKQGLSFSCEYHQKEIS